MKLTKSPKGRAALGGVRESLQGVLLRVHEETDSVSIGENTNK